MSMIGRRIEVTSGGGYFGTFHGFIGVKPKIRAMVEKDDKTVEDVPIADVKFVDEYKPTVMQFNVLYEVKMTFIFALLTDGAIWYMSISRSPDIDSIPWTQLVLG